MCVHRERITPSVVAVVAVETGAPVVAIEAAGVDRVKVAQEVEGVADRVKVAQEVEGVTDRGKVAQEVEGVTANHIGGVR